MNTDTLKTLLSIYKDAGDTDVISPKPHNRFQETEKHLPKQEQEKPPVAPLISPQVAQDTAHQSASTATSLTS